MLISKLYVVYNAAPFIVIETTGGGTLKDEIEFNELGAYVAMLTRQQAVLNKYVTFAKGFYLYNNKQMECVVISASDVPDPNPIPATLTLKLDGVDFTAPRTLAAGFNVASITGTAIANANNIPAAVTFKLPQRGFGSIDQDYTIPASTYWMAIADGAGNWLVTLVYYGAGGAQSINVLTRQAVSQDVVKLTITTTVESPVAVFPYSGTLGGYNKQAGGINNEMHIFNTPAYCGKALGNHANDQYYCIAQSPFVSPSWVVVKFRKLGLFVFSKTYQCDNIQIFFQILSADMPPYANYDEMNFEFINGAGGAGVPVNARTSVLEAGVCAAGATLYYTVDGSLTPGNVLFEDIAMTIPHLGDSFLSDPATGVINNLNNATGVIGIPTGNSC